MADTEQERELTPQQIAEMRRMRAVDYAVAVTGKHGEIALTLQAAEEIETYLQTGKRKEKDNG